MIGLLSYYSERTPKTRRPAPYRPQPRHRPFVEKLEGRELMATVTVSIFGTPNPASPGAIVSFPVTITAQLGPDDTDIQGSATVVDQTTGVVLENLPMVYAGGSPNSSVNYEFTASGTFPAGDQNIVATFQSSDPATANASGSVVEVVKEPEVVTTPPNDTTVVSFSNRKHVVKETLEVRGTSKTAVQGPFFLAIENLNPQITLVNATGHTTSYQPLGTPYVELTAGSISKKRGARVTLLFDDPFPGKVSFTHVLLHTTGTP